MLGTCSDNALLREQGFFLLSKTWKLHFLRSGTIFPKDLSITSHGKTISVQCAAVLSDRGDHTLYQKSCIISKQYFFLLFTCNQIVALNHLFMFFPYFQKVKAKLQFYCVNFSALLIDTRELPIL